MIGVQRDEPAQTSVAGDGQRCPKPSDQRQRVIQWVIRLLVIGYFLAGVGAHWRPLDGFASLVRFGDDFAERRIPELQGREVTTYPRAGYDGQFYAQLAARPVVGDPEVQHALDNPRYRSRRILLPVLAFLGGAGEAWAAVQVYALLNVAAWLVLAWYLHRRFAAGGLPGTLLWAAALCSLGTLESVHLALTDLPATLLIVLAVAALEAGRGRIAVCALAAAGLVRETSVLAVSLFSPRKGAPRAVWAARLAAGFCAVAPVVVWVALLVFLVPVGDQALTGNFDWPGAAILRHLRTCGLAIAEGEPHLRHIFGPLAMLGLGYQSIYLLRRATTDDSPWVRMTLPFAVLFWFLGDWVWAGYWAVARACLPMSVGFLLLVPTDRNLAWRIVLTSLCMPHALYRFWPEF